MAFRLRTVTAAVVSTLLVAHASAAGLGKLTVLSGIGQPLRAEIELTAVTAEEARTLQPKLASMEAFRQANIAFNPTLQTLRFAIEQRGGRQYIRITTLQPVSEPFVDVLLELNGADGRLVREYTFLLDPPELRNVQPAQATPTIQPPLAPVPAPAAIAPAPALPIPAAAPRAPLARPPAGEAIRPAAKASTATSVGAAGAGASAYKVQTGDSLSKIADRTKAGGISLDQMLVALYRANPDAFIGSNMNRLRAGQILKVPDAATSAATAAPEAQGIVIAQAADFNAYRGKLAGQVANGAARAAGTGGQSASGKIAAKVEERPGAANDALDKLKLSKAEAGAAGKRAGSQEDRIASDKAAADSAARVKELEKNVSDLQKLLEIKNKQLAERQKAADVVAPVVAAVKPAAPPDAKGSEAAAKEAAAKDAAAKDAAARDAAAKDVVAKDVVAKEAAAKDAATKDAAAKDAMAKDAAAKGGAATAAAVKPTAAPESPAKPKPSVVKAATPPATPTEAGWFDEPLSNPLVQGGAVLIALLLGAFAWNRSRAGKADKGFADTAADSSLKTNSLFGSTGGQSVDTNNSVFNSSFAPAASTLDSNEVDPVAEADVYIAYGRDVQAEEILKEALRLQPDRHAVRVKLLEIYASRKDVRAFETVATELYSMSKGEGEEWAQAAAMGLALDPDNPLYAGASTSTGLAPAVVAAGTAAAAGAALDDSAELDAFLEETTAAQPFAETIDYSASTTSLMTDTAAMTIPAAPAKAVDDGLDFDLDGMNFDSINTGPAATTAAGPEAHAAAPGAPLVTSVSPVPPSISDEAPLSATDFDFLRDDLPNALDLTPVAPLTLPEFTLAPASMSEPVAVPVLPVLPVLPTVPAEVAMHDAVLPAVAAPVHADPLEFDLSGITLDLPEAAPPAHHALSDALNLTPSASGRMATAPDDFTELDLHTPSDDEGASSGDISSNAEMATKLDLAVAYQEIGDQDGARELLDEVKKGGSPEQSEKARALLARLG